MKTTLRNLILGLVLFVILLILIGNNLLRVISESANSCQAIVVANTQKSDLFSKNENVFVEKCKPDFIQIDENHVKVNGYFDRVRIGSEFKNNFDPEDLEEAVYYVFANELYDCWSLALEGKANLGKGKGLLCSRISFTDSLKNKALTFDGLFDYLYKANIPGKDLPYSSYVLRETSVCCTPLTFKVTGVNLILDGNMYKKGTTIPLFANHSKEFFFSYSLEDNFEINTSKDYYVLFLTPGAHTSMCKVKDCTYPLQSFLFLLDEDALNDLLLYMWNKDEPILLN